MRRRATSSGTSLAASNVSSAATLDPPSRQARYPAWRKLGGSLGKSASPREPHSSRAVNGTDAAATHSIPLLSPAAEAAALQSVECMSSGINPRRKQWLLTPLHRGLLRGDAAVDEEPRAPVMKAASSEARNTMPLAISAWPRRCACSLLSSSRSMRSTLRWAKKLGIPTGRFDQPARTKIEAQGAAA